MTDEIETDVLVAGAGMAGLVAAVEATDRGADVLVLEKGPDPGGTMALSAGVVWTYGSYDAAREAVPKGDPELHDLIVERIGDGFEWLEGHGVTLEGLPFTFPSGEEFGVGIYEGRQARQMDPGEFIERMVAAIEDGGGEVRTETPFDDLWTDDGTVIGATARGPDGQRHEIRADGVVLATGGFQGNESLLRTFVTDDADDLWLRSNPWSTGDGLLAATAAGAKTAGDLGAFSGPNLLAPPATFGPEDFMDVIQSHAAFGLAIDEHGERIHDESESSTENPLAQAVAREAGGRAYVVIDHDAYRTDHLGGKPLGHRLERARDEYGGRVGSADSMAGLRELLYEWGVDGERAVETIRAFNEAVRKDEGARLDPPRREDQTSVSEPPFHAVAVQPGITYTNGGIAVTDEMAVVSRPANGSTMEPYGPADDRPTSIPGLYAAGVDVGNFSHDRYFGGLGPSLVTGRIAGRNAAERGRD